MKIFISILLLCGFVFSSAFAKEVNVNELSKNAQSIEFVNYRGSVPKVDSPADVRSIGVQLAKGVGDRTYAKYRYHLKYSVIHADSEQEPEKLAADIFYIDRRAKVGHINYVRLMLQGYLETKYGYSSKDSRTLAIFITYYNAVYRGDMDYFGETYKQVVTKNVNVNNVGLSTIFNQWPGKTAMIIPITDESQRDNINSLDTSILTDKKVIQDMRKETDMNIDERQDMIDLENKQLDKNKKDLEKKKVDQEKLEKDIKKKQQEVTKKEETIEKKKEEIKKTTDPVEKKKKQEELKKEEKELEKDKQDLEEKQDKKKKTEEEIKKKEEQIEKDKKDIDKQQDLLEKDEQEVKKKTDPDYIANKQKELEEKEQELEKKEKELDEKEEEIKKNEDPNVFDGVFYYLKINKYLDEGIYENDLYSINPATRKILKKSKYENISGRKYDVFENGVVIIGFEGQNHYNHRLILLDKETLNAKITSKDVVFYRSFIIIKEDFIYVVMMEQGKYFLGKYDKKLKRVAKSVEKVEKDSFITFYEDYIYINNDLKNKILVLNKEDLSLIDSIKP